MKYDVSFVTSVYDDISNTSLAGRHNRGTHYAFSLAQLCKMGAPFYCYTDGPNLLKYLPSQHYHGIDNVTYISYDLTKSPFYKGINALKNEKRDEYPDNIAWRQRCVEIMWGKFEWILDSIKRIGVSDDKYLFWVDAGLSHGGIIPIKYNSTYQEGVYPNNSSDYIHRFYNDLIFNPKFPDFLVHNMDNRDLFFFLCTLPQHNDPSHLLVRRDPFFGTIVGGLFGGRTSALQKVAQRGYEICEELLQNGYLLKEEDILTYVLNEAYDNDAEFLDRVKLFDFKTWYHEDWVDAYNPEDPSFADFFDGFMVYQA